jgi:hypothetical protein
MYVAVAAPALMNEWLSVCCLQTKKPWRKGESCLFSSDPYYEEEAEAAADGVR